MTDSPPTTAHKGFQITIVREDGGYQVYLKNKTRHSTSSGVSMGDKILYGPYSDQETALAAARRAIDTGEVW